MNPPLVGLQSLRYGCVARFEAEVCQAFEPLISPTAWKSCATERTMTDFEKAGSTVVDGQSVLSELWDVYDSPGFFIEGLKNLRAAMRIVGH
jgi:hypothetical protein